MRPLLPTLCWTVMVTLAHTNLPQSTAVLSCMRQAPWPSSR